MFSCPAENIAKECLITRQQQDDYAVMSQQRVDDARKKGKFLAEITPVIVKDRKGDKIMDCDEFPRPDTSVSSLAKLRPAFSDVI